MFGFNKPETRKEMRNAGPAIISHDTKFSFNTNNETKSFFGLKKEKSILKVKPKGNDDKERSQHFFRELMFLEKEKYLTFRILTSGKRANIAFIGPKATGKSRIAEIVAEKCNDVVFINSKTTIAGLAEEIRNNPNIKVIIFDEADKILDKGEKDDIRGFLQNGKLKRAIKGNPVELEIENLITIITANNAEKFDGPFLSRFTRFYISEYTDEQFKEICAFKMPNYNENMIYEIAQFLIDNKMKDARNIEKIDAMIRPNDTPEEIEEILQMYVESENTATKNVNWDKK